MRPILVCYHSLFCLEWPDNVLDRACYIVFEQMRLLRESGLEAAASEIICGINGSYEDSGAYAEMFLPAKAKKLYWGLQCRNELRTMLALQDWAPKHPGWNVLYFHCKGAVSISGGVEFSDRWRRCMEFHLIECWRGCIRHLEDFGFEVATTHWMPGMCDGTQNICAGNFFWAKSEFLATLPSILLRDRIKVSGIDSIDSRYEAEVAIGNGPRLPRVMDYHPRGPFADPCKV